MSIQSNHQLKSTQFQRDVVFALRYLADKIEKGATIEDATLDFRNPERPSVCVKLFEANVDPILAQRFTGPEAGDHA